jgi:hypothetical protein
MSAAFSDNFMRKIYFLFILGFLSLAHCGFGATIDTSAAPNTLVADQSNDLNSPGTPLPDYSFPWELSFTSTLGPTDPGFFDLGSFPGSFLMTGNTYYNFTGDARYLILVFSTPVSSGLATQNSGALQATPEPASFWLVAGVLFIAGCYGVPGLGVSAFRARYSSNN